MSAINLAKKIKEICHSGYDIYFLHGWVTSALSAPNEIDEDDITPTYLMFQNPENMAQVENLETFMQELGDFCNTVIETTLSSNEPILPLVNLKSNSVNFEKLTPDECRNLLSWIYGYLFSYLANWDNIGDYCKNEELVGELFFAPLLHLSATFILLDKEYDLSKGLDNDAKSDYADLKMDLRDMWTDDEGQSLLSDDKIVELAKEKSLLFADVGNTTSMLLNFVLEHCMNDTTMDDNSVH